MFSKLLVAFSACAAILAAGPTFAASAPVAVENAWTRATLGHSDIGAVFLSMTSPVADRLLAATTPAASRTELHVHKVEGGIMKMRQIDGIDLPAGEKVTLAPHGYHIMLFGLGSALKAGDRLPLTLSFAHAATQTVSVQVIGLREKPPAANTPSADPGMEHMDMGQMN
jgi:periplasmic copper chaperone A